MGIGNSQAAGTVRCGPAGNGLMEACDETHICWNAELLSVSPGCAEVHRTNEKNRMAHPLSALAYPMRLGTGHDQVCLQQYFDLQRQRRKRLERNAGYNVGLQ